MSIAWKTLWDILPARRRKAIDAAMQPPAPTRSRTRQSSIRDRYDALVVEMKSAYSIRIRKWRSSTSGCAWEVHYADGSLSRLIEAPYPRGPMSCAVFLHEVGHHAIGLRTYRPRCLEEFHAWRWAIETMEKKGFNVTGAVRKRMHESLHYAIRKARRRGLRRLPEELVPYLQPLAADSAA